MDRIKSRLNRLKEVCNTILYSDNIEKVVNAYDMFFTQYRQLIITAQPQAHLSCVDPVIYQIISHQPFNVEKFGLKYSPFARFIAMIKEQERLKRLVPAIRRKAESYKYPLANLKNYILIVAQTEEDFETKNTYIKDLLHQCYIKSM